LNDLLVGPFDGLQTQTLTGGTQTV
jgi:hypothetical protein